VLHHSLNVLTQQNETGQLCFVSQMEVTEYNRCVCWTKSIHLHYLCTVCTIEEMLSEVL